MLRMIWVRYKYVRILLQNQLNNEQNSFCHCSCIGFFKLTGLFKHFALKSCLFRRLKRNV